MQGQITIEEFLGQKPATCKETAQTRRESHKKTDKVGLYSKVLKALGKDVLTAREIAQRLYKMGAIDYPARAVIQPRLTELVELNVLKVVGKKYDEHTDRNVAQYWRVKE